MGEKAKAIEWLGDRVRLIDQTKLPGKEIYLELTGYRQMAAAIKQLKVRGAPAIGVAAAYGVVLGARQIKTGDREKFLAKLKKRRGRNRGHEADRRKSFPFRQTVRAYYFTGDEHF